MRDAGRQSTSTNVGHQLFLSATSDSNTTRTLALAQNAAALLLSSTIRMGSLTAQDSASHGSILDFDIGMAQGLTLAVQQDVHTLDWLLQPCHDLARSDVLS